MPKQKVSEVERDACELAEVLGDLMRDHGLFATSVAHNPGWEEATIAISEFDVPKGQISQTQLGSMAFIDVMVKDGDVLVGPLDEREIGNVELARRVRKIIRGAGLGELLR